MKISSDTHHFSLCNSTSLLYPTRNFLIRQEDTFLSRLRQGLRPDERSFRILTVSLIATLAVPTKNIPKTMSIGPNHTTDPAPIAQPAKDHLKILKNLLFPVPGRSSYIKTPVVKPKAVTTGAANQMMAFKNRLSSPDLNSAMATAIQPI